MTEPEYGEITRGDLLDALPATARIQLVSTTAEAARALADGGTVSRVYQNSLTEYAPEGDVVCIVTDTATLAGLGAEYTVLRDYGDVSLERSDEHQRPDRQLYHRVCAAGGPAVRGRTQRLNRGRQPPFPNPSGLLRGHLPDGGLLRGLRPRKKAPLLGELAELARPEGTRRFSWPSIPGSPPP